MKPIFFACLAVFFVASVAMSQEPQKVCPIEFHKVDAHAQPFWVAMRTGNPSKTYLQIEYTNRSDKTISSVRFAVNFTSDFGEEESIHSFNATDPVKPGKTSTPLWDGDQYVSEYGSRINAIA